MTSEPYSADTAASDDTLREIETLLDRVAGLARTDIASRPFYCELLAASVRAMAAVAGVVWTKQPGGIWQVESQIQLDELELESNAAAREAHERLLNEVSASGTGRLVAPHFESNGDANQSPYLLVMSPVVVAGETLAILELVQRPEGSAASQRGYLRLLGAMADIATDYQQTSQLRELVAAQGQWQQFSQFAKQIHASLDSQATAYALANEARRLIGCDRACVLVQGRSLALRAVSGTESFDPRANFVRRLEDLTAAALVTQEELWVEEDLRALPPEIETPLQAYLDECHSRSVAILPLHASDKATGELQLIGAIVIEQFHAVFDAALRKRAAVVREHGAAALGNALEVERLPFARSLRRIASASWWIRARQLPRTLAISGLLLTVLATLSFWPAELRITARGELQPELRRDVFAPLDGIVEKINIKHGQHVRTGEVLALLRSPDLELHQKRIEGERQTAQKRLEALAAGRLGKRFTTDEELQEYRRLTADEAEVKAELAGLEAQQKILEEQSIQLTVKSPIAGEVLTWDVANLLTARPVARGQSLLLVAQVDGAWVLELQLPDEQAGHVLAAYQTAEANQQYVAVEYMLATRPGEKLRGHIQSIAQATEADNENRPSVRVTIALADQQLPELRPGATAVAMIDCGQRALGYVWLHDLIDTIRTWLFF